VTLIKVEAVSAALGTGEIDTHAAIVHDDGTHATTRGRRLLQSPPSRYIINAPNP
jgi:hypothetical protein